MEIQTRHRIIGIAVIIALIMIFVPLFVSKRVQQSSPITSTIPTPPPVSQTQDGTTPPAQDQTSLPATTDQTQPVTTTSSENTCTPGSSDCVTSTSTTDDQSVPADDNQPIDDSDSSDSNDDANLPYDDSQDTDNVDSDTDATLPSDQSDQTQQQAQPQQPVQPQQPQQQVQPQPQAAPVVPPVKTVKLQSDKASFKITRIALGKPAQVIIKKPVQLKSQTLSVKGSNWLVQTGLFADTENANQLISRLHHQGFTAFGYKTQSPQGLVTHVYVGPSSDYAHAKMLQTRLVQEMNIKGYVTQIDASKS